MGSRGERVLVTRAFLDVVSNGVTAKITHRTCHRVTGALLDHTTSTSYRPSERIAALVRQRDGHCRFPGCHVNARFCDLDHVRPWPAGATTATNLICLCRRHHRVKQRLGWRVRLHADATLTWTDPTHRTRTTHPVNALAVLVIPAASSAPDSANTRQRRSIRRRPARPARPARPTRRSGAPPTGSARSSSLSNTPSPASPWPTTCAEQSCGSSREPAPPEITAGCASTSTAHDARTPSRPAMAPARRPTFWATTGNAARSTAPALTAVATAAAARATTHRSDPGQPMPGPSRQDTGSRSRKRRPGSPGARRTPH